jgi:hypothetical protein
MSSDLVFVFWSILRQTGLEAGTAISEYLVFPPGQPISNQRGLVTIYPVSEDLLQPYQGQLNLSQAVPRPREDYLSTDYIYDPQTNLGFDDTQIVAVVANQNIRLDSYVQIVIGIFEGGEYQGYTVGTKTTELSKNPYIAVDDGGNLHLIWQEGASGDRIYYATTKPEARAQLDKILLGDLPTLFLSGGLEAVTGILLFPFAFPWMAVGLVIMVILRLTRNDEDVTQGLSKILLAFAIITYQVSKLLFLPDILVYVPFSAWLDLPENLHLVMKVVVPILIFMVAIIAAEWGRRSRQSPTSSLRYYFTVILIDTVFTLSVYGVVFLGEY